MPWPEALIHFQEIDLELQRLDQRLAAIQTILQDESELSPARQHAEQAARAAHEANKAQKDIEFELQRVQTDLQQTEQRLYGGSVTQPRQLEDLQAKSQSLRRRVAKLEDDLLEAMVAREEADETAATAASDLQQMTVQREALCCRLTAEREELETHRQTLHQEAQHIKEKIPPAILDSYDYLTSRTGGIPVARLNGDICSMCGMEVLKPTQRKVRNGEEAYCDGCRRLLVA